MISAIYTTITLLTAIASFVVGGFILIKRFKTPLAKIWFFLCLTIGGWNLGYYFTMAGGISKDIALISSRISHANGILIAVLFFHFALIFLKLVSQKRRQLFLAYLSCYILAYLSLTPFIVTDLVPKLFLPYYPVGKVGYVIYVIFFIFWVVYAHYLMLKNYKKLSGYERNQLKYFLVGTVLGFTGGSTCFPLIFGFPLAPYASSLIFVYPFTTTYAIVRYKLMDMDIAIRRILSFLGYVLLSSIIFAPLFWLAFYNPVFIVPAGLLIISLAPFFFTHLPRYTRGFVDKFIFRGKFGYLDKVLHIWDDAGVDIYITLLIADRQTRWPYDIMELENALFYVHRRRQRKFRPLVDLGLEGIVIPEPIGIPSYEENHPFIQYLRNTKKPLLREEIKERGALFKVMKELEAELIIPLLDGDRLIGFVSYGKKLNEEMFHIEDIQALQKQAEIASRHLSHTLFMEERIAFSRDLAHDVKNLFDKGIFFTLDKLLNAKDDKERRKVTKTLIRQLRYMKACLGEVFDVITILNKAITKDLEATPEELRKLVQEVIALYKDSYDNKGLYIHLEISQDLPKVMVNKADIKKVFANLLDNSFKNTKQGGVTIRAEVKDKEVLVIFSDTGKGIPEDELDELFEPNLKLPEEEGEEGTGLGLVIIREIIEAHGGRIWVESKVNQGTAFYFTLPVAEEEKKR